VARDSFFRKFKTNQFPFGTFLLFLFQGIGINEFLVELCDPSQSGFNRGGSIVYIISVEAETHFKAKGIPCCQTYGFYVKFCSGVKNTVPDLLRILILKI